MKASKLIKMRFEKYVIGPIVRRLAAIVTAQAKKTREEIEKLRKEIQGNE